MRKAMRSYFFIPQIYFLTLFFPQNKLDLSRSETSIQTTTHNQTLGSADQ